MIAISACLLGLPTRYNNTIVNNLNKDYYPICPEILAGLGTPRNPVEIVGAIKTNAYDDLVCKNIKILDEFGNDYSNEFIDGCNQALQILKSLNIKTVILKDKSPSCGANSIYDGSFNNNLIK